MPRSETYKKRIDDGLVPYQLWLDKETHRLWKAMAILDDVEMHEVVSKLIHNEWDNRGGF